ncbi:MAG TPA: rhomboid family intramembrane serine protease [Anaerolineaceae bacterium]|nr:rhomboid family intramembrane serine protease [Anaerolineaceae bacterium]
MNEPARPPTAPQPGPRQATPSRPRPVVTITIAVVTVVIYLIQLLTQNILGVDLPLAFGAKSNELIMQGQIWRLVTPIFLHLSPLHIAFNMYALLIFGGDLEFSYGRIRFFMLYMLSGIAGNVASFYFSPADSAGASTAIFGLVAAQGVLVYRNREFFGSRARPILMNILFIVAINLFIGASSQGIDNWGHLGGLFGGLAFAWFAGPLYKRETVVLNYGGATAPSNPTLETPLPQLAVRLVDQVGTSQAWLVAGIELFVLGGLTIVRILKVV